MPRCVICHQAAARDCRVEVKLSLRGVRATTWGADFCPACLSTSEANPMRAARAAVMRGRMTRKLRAKNPEGGER